MREFEDVVVSSKLREKIFKYMDNTGKVLWYRFLRGAAAGAVSSGLLVAFTGENTFSDLKAFLATLIVALIVGAVTGALLAVDKFLRME